MYKILVNNDDGIEAAGIKTLVKTLSRIAEVYVVAPKTQQSGKSQSMTFAGPVEVEKVEMEGATEAYALGGTPADCAKWGIGILGESVDFDFLFSGINMGANLGTASFYSGTCAAAFEGALNGIRSIALSVTSHEASNFEYICSMIPELIEMSDSLGPETVVSVNTPDLPAWRIKGVKITEPATHLYGDCYSFKHEGGTTYQMIASHSEPDFTLDNDYNWIREDYATITTLSTALTDKTALRRLNGYSVTKSLCVFIGAQEMNIEYLEKPKRWRKNITKWAKCSNRLDMPTLIAEQHGMGEILPCISDNVSNAEKVDVSDFNAFGSEDFNSLVDIACEKRVFIAGLETHISVMQTAREFLAKGFEVVILEDCCASRNKHDHELAIKNLRKAGCRINTFEAAVMQILGGTRHEAYKFIDSILKK